MKWLFASFLIYTAFFSNPWLKEIRTQDMSRHYETIDDAHDGIKMVDSVYHYHPINLTIICYNDGREEFHITYRQN